MLVDPRAAMRGDCPDDMSELPSTARGALQAPEPRPPRRHAALPAARTLVFHRSQGHGAPRGHDAETKCSVTRSLAELLGLPFGGEHGDPATPRGDGALYLVPSETITSLAEAEALGIRGPDDLFGGVVPHPFVATKVITHPLVRADARAPEGWSHAFGQQVRAVVLPGYSVFSAADARRAARRLLADGAVRVKEPDGVGGSGQTVVSDMTQFETTLAAIPPVLLERDGLVLERNLSKVRTCSVGQVQVGPWLASYCGTQGLTRNHRGHEVYGGSVLKVVRGGYEELLELELETETRTAVEQALVYHRAAMACFTGMFASRCNYDVAQGLDEAGHWRSGVLEQSWRIGGASGAELAALHAFKRNPGLRTVRASTHEVYADGAVAPAGAQVHFEGVDAEVGRLLKYARVEPHGQL